MARFVSQPLLRTHATLSLPPPVPLTDTDITPAWNHVLSASEEDWSALVAAAEPLLTPLDALIASDAVSVGFDAQRVIETCTVACHHVYREAVPQLGAVSSAAVEARWPVSRRRIAAAEAAFQGGQLPGPLLGESPQPQLFGTVIATAMGPDPAQAHPDEVLELSDSEFWLVLAALDTVIHVLDARASAAGH